MSTSDKLTYLNGTKQALKESINNIGGDITSETTFREYAQELDNIYDNLPKTTGEGSSLSLNTLKGKMNIIPKGDTQQDGTPTPDTPIDIEVVTGTQEVKVRGINLLDKTQVVGNNTATIVTQINTGFRVSAETLGYAGVTTIDVKANTNYFLKFNTNVIVDSGAQKYVRIFAGTTQTTTIATYTFTESGGTFNTGNNTKINIWFYCSLGGSGTVDYTNVQLQEGSTATTYEPYVTPQTQTISLGDIELCKIGTYQDYLYKTSGKNLNDMSYWNTNTGSGITLTNNKDGSINVNGTATGLMVYKLSNAISLKANTTYYITGGYSENCRIDLRDNNLQTYGSSSTGVNSVGTYTPTTDTTAFLCIRVPSGITISNLKMLPMISTENNIPFEPYGSDKWYKKENIYKIANKTNWSVDNVASNNRAVISLSGNGFPYSSDIGYASANAISNNFVGISQLNQASTTEINNIAINNANMYIKFADTINTKELAKAQLDSMTSLEIYYVVATPNDIEITNTTLIEQLDNLEKLKSYNGTTNISSSGNLSAILGVSAIKGES